MDLFARQDNMNHKLRLGMALLSAFPAILLIATTLLAIPMAAAVSPQGPCFTFTSNNNPVGAPICNSAANDLTVFFIPGPNCIVTFGTLSMMCPKGANNIDFTWGPTPAGGNVITSCVWTKGNKVLKSLPCAVPPGTTTFTITDINGTVTTIPKVFWTLNGKRLGKVIKPPAGIVVNDLEFTV
jgi:hypothetical protein